MTPKNFTQSQVVDACRILFPGALIQQEFLQKLHVLTVKRNYRKLAKECHPDCCAEPARAAMAAEQFRRINNAYELLCAFVREREIRTPARSQAYRPAATPQAATQEVRPKQQGERVFRPRPVIPKPARNPDDVYYDGPLPTYRLKFGLYLYYKGVIPYSAIVKALMWQRDMRPPIGQLAVAWGFLEPHFVSVIRAATEIPGTFGERAVKLGLLSEAQMGVLLLHQKMMQTHVGRYFVGKGYLTEWELNKHLREMHRFNQGIPEKGSRKGK
ncbi:J domain-containing protein [Geomesophilobacter sediminis]|uniref:J domain-containing protein n=1 Tax=Geomesophilobacter sediminis TaxID=2798584 RepID=A0A8J7S8T7_9BACT|nr:J domain-containing protein [Geomesophilobacter sediminis]MBJ6726621.1 J domain-containing protein [Geomesophilobacter sediminis]